MCRSFLIVFIPSSPSPSIRLNSFWAKNRLQNKRASNHIDKQMHTVSSIQMSYHPHHLQIVVSSSFPHSIFFVSSLSALSLLSLLHNHLHYLHRLIHPREDIHPIHNHHAITVCKVSHVHIIGYRRGKLSGRRRAGIVHLKGNGKNELIRDLPYHSIHHRSKVLPSSLHHRMMMLISTSMDDSYVQVTI